MAKAPGNGNRPLSPGVPNINDGSQPTPEENLSQAQARQEELRRQVQADLGRDPEEKFRWDDEGDGAAQQQGHGYSGDPRDPMYEQNRRRDARDGDIDLVRGGSGRAYTQEDWSRAMMPTDPERRRMIRMRFEEAVLPNLPKREGWHRIWISTTHNYDTPQFRLGLGYHFCTYEQLGREGWAVDQYAVKDSRNVYSGCVMWREMIAMETDLANWFAIMRELHHDQPYEQARSIYDTIDAAGEQVRAMGGRTMMSPGMESLRTFTRPPSQFMT